MKARLLVIFLFVCLSISNVMVLANTEYDDIFDDLDNRLQEVEKLSKDQIILNYQDSIEKFESRMSIIFVIVSILLAVISFLGTIFSIIIPFYNNKKYDKLFKEFNDIKDNALEDKKRIDSHTSEIHYVKSLTDITLTEKLKYINKALECEPDNDIYNEQKAIILFELKDYKKSSEQYTYIIEESPDYYTTKMHYSRGICYYNLNRYNDAILDFQKVIDIEDNNENSYFYIIACFHSLNDEDKVIEYFNLAIKRCHNVGNFYHWKLSHLKSKNKMAEYKETLDEMKRNHVRKDDI